MKKNINFSHIEKDDYLDKYKEKVFLIYISKNEATQTFNQIEELIKNKIKVILVIDSYSTVTFMCKSFHNQISKVIFISESNGLIDYKGDLVDFVESEQLSGIENKNSYQLTHKKNSVTISEEMHTKLVSIKKILEFVPNVAICNPQGIMDEITNFEGSGTLLCNKEHAQFEKLKYYKIFKAVYEHNVAPKGKWKTRTDEELQTLFENHTVLTVNESILGGYSLTKDTSLPSEGLLLECLWAAKLSNGLGSKLMESAITQAKQSGKSLFAYSSDPIFEKCGFKKLDIKSKASGAPLWIYKI